ncbi:hypothetical protein V6N11_048258 [Hibiscus sabdariffa]|uniref:Uncharacterized protein n=1 Tax=Hibiscus sabdariffa TaxID=183260 RepID=A0ABR2PUX0_9ROSI
MVLRAPVFVSDSYESVKNPALVTHPPRIAEEKGRPKEVYLGVPGVILSRRHRPVTNVPFFGLAVQKEISKWEKQEGKCEQQWEGNAFEVVHGV